MVENVRDKYKVSKIGQWASCEISKVFVRSVHDVRLLVPCWYQFDSHWRLLGKQFRQLCVANGIAAPAFMRVVGPFEESARRQFESLGMSMPVVVKPAMGAGSNYVKKACRAALVSSYSFCSEDLICLLAASAAGFRTAGNDQADIY
jgi:hypothetical protein